MIDIHSHILPGFDDGARTMEDSLAMALMAAAAGTTDIVATPHSSPQFAFDAPAVEKALAGLQQAAGTAIRIHYGCELHLTPENIDLALRFPQTYSLGHHGYVLLEFAGGMVPKTSGEILGCMLARGLRPIVAHPERNPILRKRPKELESWVEQGCFLQVTAQSLLGNFGKTAQAAGHEWIEHGLVHFLASDAHDRKHRPPVLNEARDYVEHAFGPDIAERLLMSNPRAILEGATVATGRLPVRKKSWFARW